MEWLDTHIGSTDAAFQETPEVFKPISMNPTVHIFDSVIDNLVGLVGSQPLIGKKRICIESRASFNMLFDFSLKSNLFPIRNYSGANLATPFKDTHDSDLVFRTSSRDARLAFGDMHVPGFAADESLIRFDFAGELRKCLVMHGLTDAMEHKPCAFLRDAKRSSNFTGTNAVLAVAEHPERTHPLIKSKRTILKDRAYLKRELLLTSRAEPDAARLDKRVFLRATARAGNYAVRPAKVERILKAAVRIAEVNNRVLKCLGRVHELNLRRIALCVKYVIAPFSVS